MKPNLSLNVLGRYLEAVARNLDAYPPTGGLEPPFRGPDGGVRYRWANAIPDLAVSFLAREATALLDGYYKTLAGARLTQVFVALRCCQLEHGALPAKLDDLAPEYVKAVPLDPFTGRPLGYEPDPRRPSIWSAGPHSVDSGGAEEGGQDIVIPLSFAGR